MNSEICMDDYKHGNSINNEEEKSLISHRRINSNSNSSNTINIIRAILECCILIMLFVIMIFIVILAVYFMAIQSDVKKFLKDGDQLLANTIPNELIYYHKIIRDKNNNITQVVSTVNNIITDINNSIKKYNTIIVVNEIIANVHTQLNHISTIELMGDIRNITLSIIEIEKKIHNFVA